MPENEASFSIPQVLVICAFVAGLSAIAGWTLNLEIRKADRAEIIGKSYQEALNGRLSSIENQLYYIRDRLDSHMKENGRLR